MFYFAEAGGMADNVACAVFWGVEPNVSCRVNVTAELVQEIGNVGSDEINVAADGSLNVGEGNLPAAGISLTDLLQLPNCEDIVEPDNTDGGTVDGGLTGGEITDGGDNLTPLSCSGTRVWGPLDTENGVSVFVSEASGIALNVDCAVYWGIDLNQNCKNNGSLAVAVEVEVDDINVGVTADGSLALVNFDGEVATFPAAGISLSDILETPDCP